MILILSNLRFESSTDSVCDWLIYLNTDFSDPYTGEWKEWSTNPLKQKAIKYYGI
jgi:hypothetical protein